MLLILVLILLKRHESESRGTIFHNFFTYLGKNNFFAEYSSMPYALPFTNYKEYFYSGLTKKWISKQNDANRLTKKVQLLILMIIETQWTVFYFLNCEILCMVLSSSFSEELKLQRNQENYSLLCQSGTVVHR